MRLKAVDLLFLLAVIAGTVYFAQWLGLDGRWRVTEKGACVALLAVWAVLRAPRTIDGRLIALVLILGALGDILLETHGLTAGALAFLAGHLVAILLYLRNRARPIAIVPAVAVAVAAVAWFAPLDRGAAPGIALYAAGLGLMAGAALASRFPLHLVALGALLFVFSDLTIFWRMGPLQGSPWPGALIWPTYMGGQALIAWGVVSTLVRERAR